MNNDAVLIVRVPNNLKFRVERIVDGEFWKSKSDFVRRAIEKQLKKHEVENPVHEDW